MRRRFLLLLLTILLALGTSPVAAAASRIRPSGEPEAVKIRVERKLRTYHLATSRSPVEYRIDGPTPIRVLSRYLFAAGSDQQVVSYGLRIEIDGVELRTLSEEAVVSTRSTLADGEVVGSLEKAVVQIPSGSHKVLISPVEAGISVALRVLHGHGRPKQVKWVPYAPDTYEKPVRLHGRDSEAIYYRFNVDVPVTLSINGPLRVRVMTRLDFDHENGYSQAYVIKTFVDGEQIQSCPLKTRASHTSTYPELPEVTPGVARDVLFDVPEGRHEVTITLDGTTAKSASLRILIPEKAVTNGA
jgi:hypothetical protein